MKDRIIVPALCLALTASLFVGLLFSAGAAEPSRSEPAERGEEVVIFYPEENKVMTTESCCNSVNSVLTAENARLIDGRVATSSENAALFTVLNDGVNTTFRTADGKFLYADGTGIGLVETEGKFTKFVVEETTGGVYIRAASAKELNRSLFLVYTDGGFSVCSFSELNEVSYIFGLHPLLEEEKPCEHNNTELRNVLAATCTDAGFTGDRYCLDCGAKLESGSMIPALGHHYSDGVCICGAKDPDAQQLAIRSAALYLDEDLNMIYAADVPAEYTEPYMIFTFQGRGHTVDTYKVNTEGQYCFAFENIDPQCMNDSITATLYATKDGETVSVSKENYSVLDYCANQLAKTENAVLKTLLSDILTYGAAAQTYVDYKTDALVTEGLTLSPSPFAALSGKAATFIGEQDANTCWIGASLVLSNDLATRFTFVTDSTNGLKVEVSINGETQTFTDFEALGDGRYCITFDGIKATEFEDNVTATFGRNGTIVGAELNYSVNTYICQKQDSPNGALANLVRALYNYGASAKAYAEK